MWCIPKVDAEFVARMEDVLALCAERRPVVCFDETPRQLIGEELGGSRRAWEAAALRLRIRAQRHCQRLHVCRRESPVAMCIDLAECMRDLVDEHYPDAELIHVVLACANLSALGRPRCTQRFAPAEAHDAS